MLANRIFSGGAQLMQFKIEVVTEALLLLQPTRALQLRRGVLRADPAAVPDDDVARKADRVVGLVF